jgi:membrane protease YdiL (CAAX protease family)
MIRKMLLEVYNDTETDSTTYLSNNSSIPDRKVITVCIAVAFSLSLIYYCGNPMHIAFLIKQFSGIEKSSAYLKLFYDSPNARILQLSQWVAFIVIGYLVIPMLIIKFYFKENISAFGFAGKIRRKDFKIYGLMLLVMIPIVIAMSYTNAFQHKYPFYHDSKALPDAHLFIWEAEYMLQFFALEFFFRGFFLHGIKQRFGFYSIFVMMIPYCMIHFGKPFPETISAIVAGLVLGILSLKSNNIWLGFLIHCSVAITMDICSIWQQGLL